MVFLLKDMLHKLLSWQPVAGGAVSPWPMAHSPKLYSVQSKCVIGSPYSSNGFHCIIFARFCLRAMQQMLHLR